MQRAPVTTVGRGVGSEPLPGGTAVVGVDRLQAELCSVADAAWRQGAAYVVYRALALAAVAACVALAAGQLAPPAGRLGGLDEEMVRGGAAGAARWAQAHEIARDREWESEREMERARERERDTERAREREREREWADERQRARVAERERARSAHVMGASACWAEEAGRDWCLVNAVTLGCLPPALLNGSTALHYADSVQFAECAWAALHRRGQCVSGAVHDINFVARECWRFARVWRAGRGTGLGTSGAPNTSSAVFRSWASVEPWALCIVFVGAHCRPHLSVGALTCCGDDDGRDGR